MFSKNFGVLTLAVGMAVGGIMAMPGMADARSSSSGGGFSGGGRSYSAPSYSAPRSYSAPAPAAPSRSYSAPAPAAPAVQSRPAVAAPAQSGATSNAWGGRRASQTGVAVGAGLAVGGAAGSANSQTAQAGSSTSPNGVKNQNFGGSRQGSGVANQKPANKTDLALSQKATMTGFKSKSRAEQTQMLSQKYGNSSKYSFKTQPKVRPSYIPQNASVGGRNYTVVYNNGHYGYYGPSHVWSSYDPFSNMLLAAALMEANDRTYNLQMQQNYLLQQQAAAQTNNGYYAQQPMSAPTPVAPVPRQSNPWPGIILLSLACGVVGYLIIRSRF